MLEAPRSPSHIVLMAGFLASLLACGSPARETAAGAGKPASSGTRSSSAAGAGTPAATPTAEGAGRAADACRDIADWRGEIIPLPPGFAPSLPAGKEDLRFAPGMYDPDADDYFTYAFVLAFDGAPDLGAAGLQALLDAYYRGLIAAVARSKDRDLPVDTIASRVTPHGTGFRAEVAIYDAFVTGKPLDLHMDLAVEGTCVKVKTSPQPRDHPVWQLLARAVDCLSCTIAD